jgi:hypothetical protein
VQVLGLNAKPGLVAGRFRFSYYFYFNRWSETKMQTFANLFLACKRSGLFGFAILIVDFGRCRGLTCDFWAKNSKKEIYGLVFSRW